MTDSRIRSFIHFAFTSTLIISVRTLSAVEELHSLLLDTPFRTKNCVACPLATQDNMHHEHHESPAARCSCLETLARRIDPRRM
jgi:hypothetical protein